MSWPRQSTTLNTTPGISTEPSLAAPGSLRRLVTAFALLGIDQMRPHAGPAGMRAPRHTDPTSTSASRRSSVPHPHCPQPSLQTWHRGACRRRQPWKHPTSRRQVHRLTNGTYPGLDSTAVFVGPRRIARLVVVKANGQQAGIAQRGAQCGEGPSGTVSLDAQRLAEHNGTRDSSIVGDGRHGEQRTFRATKPQGDIHRTTLPTHDGNQVVAVGGKVTPQSRPRAPMVTASSFPVTRSSAPAGQPGSHPPSGPVGSFAPRRTTTVLVILARSNNQASRNRLAHLCNVRLLLRTTGHRVKRGTVCAATEPAAFRGPILTERPR